MDTLMGVSPTSIGLLVWLVWALIGILGALVARRATGRSTFVFDLIIGVVAGVLGGFLSTRFLGDTPVQLFLISILGSVFFVAAALWITSALMAHFRKDM